MRRVQLEVPKGSLAEFGAASIPRQGKGRARVLLFSVTPFYGGGEIFYVKLARLLSEHYELAAIAASWQLCEQFALLGIPTRRLSPGATPAAAARFCGAAYGLANAIRTFRPDCVHLNGQAESYFAVIPSLFSVPSTSTRHTPFDHRIAAYKRLAVQQNLRLVSRTVCVSSVIKRQLASVVDESRLVTIPNWIDPLPETLPYSLPRAGETFRLLYLGRIERSKGVFDLITALRDIPSVSLDVVGDGPDAAEARDVARDLPIVFHGFQANCARFYRSAHLLVFPSHWEGQGFVPIEAMAHGLPALISNIPACLETADQGRAAELFQCGNVIDLASKIRALQCDPERLSALSVRGVEHVHMNYTAEQARNQYFKVFDEVIGKL